MGQFLYVGLGGAAGAMLRYAISLLPYSRSFPLLTLLTNLTGAVVIGYLSGLAAKRDVPAQVMLLLKTGLCGGFTTFSTFSLETFELLQNGQFLPAGLYALGSLTGCVAGVWCGMMLA